MAEHSSESGQTISWQAYEDLAHQLAASPEPTMQTNPNWEAAWLKRIDMLYPLVAYEAVHHFSPKRFNQPLFNSLRGLRRDYMVSAEANFYVGHAVSGLTVAKQIKDLAMHNSPPGQPVGQILRNDIAQSACQVGILQRADTNGIKLVQTITTELANSELADDESMEFVAQYIYSHGKRLAQADDRRRLQQALLCLNGVRYFGLPTKPATVADEKLDAAVIDMRDSIVDKLANSA